MFSCYILHILIYYIAHLDDLYLDILVRAGPQKTVADDLHDVVDEALLGVVGAGAVPRQVAVRYQFLQ